MQRYLLFDAGCSVCTRMAQELDDVSNGWFTARSLRDQDMQALLKSARPNAKWEPTLLEVKGTTVRVSTGLKMRARVAAGVGARRAWQMAKIVYGQQTTNVGTPAVPARRKFLHNSALFGGIVFGTGLPLAKGQAAAAKSASPVVLTRVKATDQIIGLLRTTDAAQQATVHFGILAWDEVYQLSSSTSAHVGYMIPSTTTPSYVFVGNPRTGHQKHNFVIQPKGDSNDNLAFLWFSPSGQALASTQVRNEKGVLSNQGTAKTSKFDRGCFARCAGIAVGICASPCGICAGVPIPQNPACIVCVGCAGSSALFCVIACS